jgi:hypothetical protein
MKIDLHFDNNGKFKIMMFSDLQDKLPIHYKSLDLLKLLIETEKPDFVISVGDQCNGSVESIDYFKKYVTEMSKHMESKGIYWSHVFGNHDDEFISSSLCDKEHQQEIFENFKYCLSESGPQEVDGIGNYVISVKSNQSDKIVFNIWALDSNKYIYDNDWYKNDYMLPNTSIGNCGYDFIKFSQMQWYWNTSVDMEKKCGYKIPGLMFFHIALPEHLLISMNAEQTKMTGEKNETICNSMINSGMFATALQRGDIKGIFVGHDHINDCMGKYFGIMLGFDGSIGYGNYGFNSLVEKEQNRLRGARFFEISEEGPSDIKTWMRYGHEFNI